MRHLSAGQRILIAEEYMFVEVLATPEESSVPIYHFRNLRSGKLVPMMHETLEWLVGVGLAEVR